MPIHDWTRVEAGIFHHLHGAWINEISNAFNDGLLPRGFYALAEQHAGRTVPDVLTLHAGPEAPPPSHALPVRGGIALAEAPPRVRRRHSLDSSLRARRRTLAIRHVSGDRLVAVIEIVSPANKDRAASVAEFSAKVVGLLRSSLHVLVVDILPPGPHDHRGLHEVIREAIEGSGEPYDLPSDEPLTFASYVAGRPVDVYLEHAAVGAALPEMPLFLNPDRYVNVPLKATYAAAYRGVPARWRDVVEGRRKRPRRD